MPARRSSAGDALTDLVLKVFRLNGRFLDVAEQITAGTGLTAARWQVLGSVLREPLPVATVARNMGLARQSVQRLADLLVAEGLCEYRDNPAHRRAKLLAPTPAGWAAVDGIHPTQADWANRVAAAVGEDPLRAAIAAIDAVLATLASPQGKPRRSNPPPPKRHRIRGRSG